MHRTITKWEIFVPPIEPGALSKTVTVEAANWMDALTAGLDQIGQEGPTSSNLMLDIKDGAFHVTDLHSRRVFEVQPLSTRTEAGGGVPAERSTPPAPGLTPLPSQGPLKKAESHPKTPPPKKFEPQEEEPGPKKAETKREKLSSKKAKKKKNLESKQAEIKSEKTESKKAETKEKNLESKAEASKGIQQPVEPDGPTPSVEQSAPVSTYTPKSPSRVGARGSDKRRKASKKTSRHGSTDFLDTVRLTPTKSIGEPKLSKAAPLMDVVVIPEKGDIDTTRKKETPSAEPAEATPPRPADSPAPAGVESESTATIPAQGDLVAHEIFFVRDEDAGDGNRLTYRERLIAVSEEASSDSAEKLLRHYYKRIKKEIAKKPRGKFINLAVFDHVFRERARRPAIAALDWKDWKRKPNISFPLEAPSVVETSFIPGVQQARADGDGGLKHVEAPSTSRPDGSEATSGSSSGAGDSSDAKTDGGPKSTRKPRHKSGKHKQAQQEKDGATEGNESGEALRRTPSQQLNIGRVSKAPDLNEVLVEVFEAMQDLYFIDRKRAAIKFAIDLIADKIPCRAVAGLSIVPDNPDEMVYVTARGDGVEAIIGKRSPLRGTVLGLAVRQGVAVAVSDAQNDSRVKAELEHLIDDDTRSVLCVPFTFEGITFGAAELVNREDGDSWRQGEIHIVSYVANHLSEYIAQSLDSHDDFEADFASATAAPAAPARPAPVTEKHPAAQKPKTPTKATSHAKKSRKKKKKR